jgi:nitrogen regulatory protein PII
MIDSHYDEEGTSIELSKMLKLEIIVSGEDEAMVTEMIQKAGVTGYTIIPNVSGYGHDGFHEGRLLFNDMASLIMIMTVAPQSVINSVAKGMKTLFEEKSGVMFVSEVSVARMGYFSLT